jgi:lysyl-tRNA synthetase class 2
LSEQKPDTQHGSHILKQRFEKARDLEASGVDLFPNEFRKDTAANELVSRYESWSAEDLEKLHTRFALAGRIMTLRSFGKATFFHLQDQSGQIQIFVQKKNLGEEEYALFKKLDIGDIVGVQGPLFRTRKEELTLDAEFVRLVSKSMRPLPEKYHGLKDVEARYRQRYLDLAVNPQTQEIFRTRTRIIKGIREFLDRRGFLEVETPMMQHVPGGAEAKPFSTYHNALDTQLYLRIAPELYLKRLLVGGLEKVYEINRNFRNEGISTQHNPEFTMLEFYWAHVDYSHLMQLTEELFSELASSINGGHVLTYQGHEVDLTPPWPKLSFHQALEELGGLSARDYQDPEQARALVRKHGENVQEKDVLGKLQAKLFDLLVEPQLIQPHFITKYPTDISPLSRRNEADPSLTDRFELFLAGREMANAFTELNDPRDQRQRFEEQARAKARGDDEAHFLDEDYLVALEHGMPPAAGEGIGIDRLAMLFTDSASIREVILFPLLKPETKTD